VCNPSFVPNKFLSNNICKVSIGSIIGLRTNLDLHKIKNPFNCSFTDHLLKYVRRFIDIIGTIFTGINFAMIRRWNSNKFSGRWATGILPCFLQASFYQG
jgi:hypothetical protein